METKELPSICRFIPKILLAITVTVCDEVYKKIALWLNDMGKSYISLQHNSIYKMICIFGLFYNICANEFSLKHKLGHYYIAANLHSWLFHCLFVHYYFFFSDACLL